MGREESVTLGHYNYRWGGSIYIPMGVNMEYSTTAGTIVHEGNHMHLDHATTLGILLEAFEIETFYVPANKRNYMDKLIKLKSIIRSRMAEVQEIYANAVELLLLEELGGMEEARRCYNNKTSEYKAYCDKWDGILDQTELSTEERRKIINTICFYACGTDRTVDEFVDILCKGQLSSVLDGDDAPIKRFTFALTCYHKDQEKILVDSICRQKPEEILIMLHERKFLEYANEYYLELKNLKHNIDQGLLKAGQLKDSMEEYQKNIWEKIKVFDLSNIKVQRQDLIENHGDGIFIIKNCENLLDKDNYYIISHDGRGQKPVYISSEESKEKTAESIRGVKCACIPSREFDFLNKKPFYLDKCKVPVFVVFTDYRDCERWIREEVLPNDYFIGDLYDDTVKNDFTVLFFAERKRPDIIYCFPSVKQLALMMMDELLLNDVIYAKDKEFLKLFAGFGNTLDIMQGVQWLLAFFTDSRGEYDVEKDQAAKLSLDVVTTLLNKSFRIGEDEYKYRALLPTRKTRPEKFFCIMKFDGAYNTGQISAQPDGNIIIFPSKETARIWIEACSEKCGAFHDEVMVMDRYYWNNLKKRLKIQKMNIYLFVRYLAGYQAYFHSVTVDMFDSIV